MIRSVYIFVLIAIAALISGCASGSLFFDSALNDKNRVPASLGIPEAYDIVGVTTIDPMHNQAEADFLFLKAEMESNSGNGSNTIEILKSALVYDPNASTIMQKLAIEYYKLAKMKDAIYWAERAKEVAPGRRDLNLLLAGLYTSTRKYDKAEVLYKNLINQDSEDTEALLYIGAVYTEQKNYPKAVETFKALCKHPAYSSKYLAHYYLARVYYEQSKSNYKKIIAELERAVLLKPDFIEAVSMLGQFLESREGKDKAASYYASYQRKHGPNVKIAELLVQYYIGNNNYDKAFEQLEIIDASSEDQMQAKLKMALILIDKKIYDKAIAKLNEILELAPESDKVRFYLAAVYEEKKEFKNAYDQYKQIATDSQFYEDSRIHAAFLAKLMGNIDDAIVVLKESVDKKAENPRSYFLMSQLFEDKKDFKNALKVLAEAEQKFSTNSQYYYYLGTLQDRMNLKEDMLDSMKKVIEIEPEHAQALNYIAYTWAEKGMQLDLAEKYARIAVEKEKEDAYILDTLGWILYKKGRFKEAVKTLNKAHEMQPDSSIIAEHLGDVYSKMNLHEKAQAFFKRAAANEADVVRQEEIKSKLVQAESNLKNLRMPSSFENSSHLHESP